MNSITISTKKTRLNIFNTFLINFIFRNAGPAIDKQLRRTESKTVAALVTHTELDLVDPDMAKNRR